MQYQVNERTDGTFVVVHWKGITGTGPNRQSALRHLATQLDVVAQTFRQYANEVELESLRPAKIENVGDWHSYDALGGKPLRQGEKLRVHFKDKSVCDVIVSIYQGPETKTGACDTCSTSYAYTKMDVRGQSVEVRLTGLEAERL